ncbi:type I-E CRISPR-associated protein Cse1/CasA [Streptomyces hygroscopicus]|uniref:type I-E CRISPR-associated protein Cse1/CasA n=1 Tax=Streptomyces hygroscopicus TaxID=1912 RepID=UPI0004C89448|nr:type I-E CRISPR-associated protein Cse1/CasA [Streptomyces hygroscopicus]
MEFNLFTEPWLPLMRTDGTIHNVSLRQALVHARHYRRLVGISPTMTVALHRVLLAVVHRAYRPIDVDQWTQLWESEEGLPEEPLQVYLEKFGHRFDLFHPHLPFLQCPALDNPPGTTAKLVPYRATGNNRTLFDHTTADQRPLLEPAEAARWMITTQMYDTSGTKQPYRKERSSEAGLGNRFACVLVEGNTFHETLLLNLLRYDPEAELPPLTRPDDHPAWEEPHPPDPEPDTRAPRGWTDLLTWPARRIRLSATQQDGHVLVDGVVLTPGTRFKGDLADLEAMTASRRPWLKGGKQGPLEPVKLDQLRGVWQHSQELLLATDPQRWWNTWKARQRANTPFPAQEPERRRPAALEHIAELVDVGVIPENTIYTLRVFGQQLGNRGGDTYAWAEEAVPAPVALLRAENARVGIVIGYAVSLANDLGEALRAMERAYQTDFGFQLAKDQEPLPTELEIRYWPCLAAPFAQFLRDLGEAVQGAGPETAAAQAWVQTATLLADRAAWQWLQGTPRRNRDLLTASAHFDDFQAARRHAEWVFHNGLARYSTPEEDDE